MCFGLARRDRPKHGGLRAASRREIDLMSGNSTKFKIDGWGQAAVSNPYDVVNPARERDVAARIRAGRIYLDGYKTIGQ